MDDEENNAYESHLHRSFPCRNVSLGSIIVMLHSSPCKKMRKKIEEKT